VTRAPIIAEPALPAAHGPLSTAVRLALTGPPAYDRLARIGSGARDSDPYGLDLQLALCMCYELHYRGFAGVDPCWEWNPALLGLRGELERVFLAGVRRDVGPIEPGRTAATEMEALTVEPPAAPGPHIICATTEPGSKCANTSCTVPCITSRRATRTPERSVRGLPRRTRAGPSVRGW